MDHIEIDWSAVWSKVTEFALTVGGRILLALLCLIAGKITIRLTMRALRRTRFFKKTETGTSKFLLNFIRIVLEILLAVMIVSILGVPMTSIVAIITAAAAAIGLALQGALSNFAGGIMILIFHPFRLDDYIEAGSFAGTVMDIGIFYTVLRTPDNREVTIPNGAVMSQPLVNYSAYDVRRIDLDFSVAYGTDIDLVRRALLETASAHTLVLPDPAPFARLTDHQESSLKFTLRVWVKRADFWTVKFDLLEQVNRRFASDGIVIPFNQLDVHLNPSPASGKEEKE